MPKTAHSPTEEFSWREDDLISLLAWSEICGNHGINFNETVEAYIHDVQKSSGQVVSAITSTQARCKISDLRRRADTTTYSIRDSRTNIRFIPAVEIQKKVAEMVTNFESNQENNIAKLKGQYTVSDHGKSTPQRMGGSSRQERSPEPRASRSDDARPTTRQQKRSSTSSYPKVEVVNYRPSATTKDPTHDQEDEVATQATVACSINSSNYSHELEVLERKHAEELKRKEEEIRALREDGEAKLRDLQHKQADRVQNEQDMREQAKIWQTAERDVRKAGKSPMENTIFSYTKMNSELLRRVDEMRKHINFCQKVPEAQLGVSIQQSMDETMSKISLEMEGILSGLGRSVRLQTPIVDRKSDLGYLIRSISDNKRTPADESFVLHEAVTTFGSEPEVIVHTLLSAALREWVFRSDFPNFDNNTSSLLRVYRKLVKTHDGWDCAHNLDLAAYQSLISDPNFKDNIIPDKASSLVGRFSRALSTLFGKKVGSEPYVEFDTWDQSPRAYENTRHKLIGVFSAALALKATTVMREVFFNYIVPPFGTLEPTGESSPGSHARHSMRRQPAQEKWDLLGSMYIYSQPTSTDPTIVLDNFVAEFFPDTVDYVCLATLSIARENRQIFQENESSHPGSSSAGQLDAQQRLAIPNDRELQEVRHINCNEAKQSDEIESSPGIGIVYICKNCGLNFSDEKLYRGHYRQGKCGRCSECGYICQTEDFFFQHAATSHQSKPDTFFHHYRSYEELLDPEDLALLNPHGDLEFFSRYPRITVASLSCQKCKMVFKTARNKRDHEYKEVCQPCPYCIPVIWYSNRSLLKQHLASAHPTDCSTKKRGSSSRENEVVKATSPVQEQLLSAETPSRASRRSNRSDGRFPCQKCSQVFRDPSQLEKHAMSHECEEHGHFIGKDMIRDGITKALCSRCQILFVPPPAAKRRKTTAQGRMPDEVDMISTVETRPK